MTRPSLAWSSIAVNLPSASLRRMIALIDGKVVTLEPIANKKKMRRREPANGKIVELDGAAITKKHSAA